VRLAGSGIGAVVAALLTLGYTSHQLEQLLSFNIRNLMRGTYTFHFISCHFIKTVVISYTNCARGDTICLRPLQVDNIFVFIRQVAPVSACWLFKTSATR